MRHFLARLRRKTKCYSKCKNMLKYSLLLLMLKRNGELYFINNTENEKDLTADYFKSMRVEVDPSNNAFQGDRRALLES